MRVNNIQDIVKKGFMLNMFMCDTMNLLMISCLSVIFVFRIKHINKAFL